MRRKNQENEVEKEVREEDQWLAEFRSTLSPYWSSRVEYRGRQPVLALKGMEQKG